MTRYARWLSVCALLFSTQSMTAANCEGSWCSTPIIRNANTCITKHRSPCERGCSQQSGFFFGADGLYWTTYQTNLDYAVDFNNGTEASEILGPGNTHFLEYNWCGGIRGYLGFKTCGFDTIVTYTWIRNDARGKKNTEESDTDLKASLLHPSTGLSDAELAYGRLDLTYETLDVLLGREVDFCDNKMLVHPFVGLRMMKIKQDEKVTYEGEDFVDAPEQVRWDSTLEGIGIHAGVDLYYTWKCGIGFYGVTGASLLASKADDKHWQYTLDENGDPIDPPRIDLKNQQDLVIPGYHLQAGIAWESCCNDCWYVRFRIGYEFNQWLRTPQLKRYHYNNDGVSNSSTSGNIALHGGTFGFDLRF